MSNHNLLGHGQAQELLGAWQQIVGGNFGGGFNYNPVPLVGWQAPGYPTNLHHGPYGGSQARTIHPHFAGYGGPRQGGPWGHGGPWGNGDWQYQIPPRNLMVDRPGPSRADRILLPMSSGVNILPNTSAQITSRPQNVAFRPERIIIGGAAGDWIVNDVKVGNRSQFSQSGDLPGDIFAATTIDSFVSFETVQTAMDFVMLVTYVGTSESGAPFVCGVLGTAAV